MNDTSGGGGSGGGSGLEGTEVIAVNGTPVRDPRHAAELVARAVDEVRLTVKRGGGTGGAETEGREDVDEHDVGGGEGGVRMTRFEIKRLAPQQ